MILIGEGQKEVYSFKKIKTRGAKKKVEPPLVSSGMAVHSPLIPNVP
jgi:hypothetical protein